MTSRLLRRVPRNVVMAILLGYFAYTLASWFLVWNPADGGAYYDAASRLTHGQPLYPPINPEAHEVYRYAPWFAVAWIPLTALPRDFALHAWSPQTGVVSHVVPIGDFGPAHDFITDVDYPGKNEK